MMTENEPRVSAYDFFALLKKHKAFDDYIAAFSDGGPRVTLHEFFKANPTTSWLSGAFTWSSYTIHGQQSWMTRRHGWNGINREWRQTLDPNYRP